MLLARKNSEQRIRDLHVSGISVKLRHFASNLRQRGGEGKYSYLEVGVVLVVVMALAAPVAFA